MFSEWGANTRRSLSVSIWVILSFLLLGCFDDVLKNSVNRSAEVNVTDRSTHNERYQRMFCGRLSLHFLQPVLGTTTWENCFGVSDSPDQTRRVCDINWDEIQWSLTKMDVKTQKNRSIASFIEEDSMDYINEHEKGIFDHYYSLDEVHSEFPEASEKLYSSLKSECPGKKRNSEDAYFSCLGKAFQDASRVICKPYIERT